MALSILFSQKNSMDAFKSLLAPLPIPQHENKSDSLQIPQKETSQKLNKSEAPRLKLKDYLRLNNIKRKNAMNSQLGAKENGEVKRGKKSQTEQNIQILRQELKSDINRCLTRLSVLLDKTSKLQEKKVENQEQQLVFLCDLHRRIKEKVYSNIEQSIVAIEDRNDEIMFNLLTGTKTYVDKKQRGQSPLRKKKF